MNPREKKKNGTRLFGSAYNIVICFALFVVLLGVSRRQGVLYTALLCTEIFVKLISVFS